MSRRKTNEEYLEELKEKGIDILPVEEYQTSQTKILHRCIEGHQWYAPPNRILKGKGCPECYTERAQKTHEQYLEELFEKEIDCEPLETYINKGTKILHRCIEGHQWYASPNSILRGRGCSTCYGNKKLTHKQYLEELKEKGIDILPAEEYQGGRTKILHRCIEGHQWYTKPSNLLYRGTGCPECAKSGFNPEKSAILYYLKVNEYYKVGVTNNTVEKRFNRREDKEKITVLFEKYYERGQDAYEQEQAILKEFADYRIHVPELLSGRGNTELFIEDVLQFNETQSYFQGG